MRCSRCGSHIQHGVLGFECPQHGRYYPNTGQNWKPISFDEYCGKESPSEATMAHRGWTMGWTMVEPTFVDLGDQIT